MGFPASFEVGCYLYVLSGLSKNVLRGVMSTPCSL